jgi:hypothetical protein
MTLAMADSVTFRDRTYGAGDILTALVTFQTMGDDSGATDFLSALPDGALRKKAGEALGEMIARGTADHAEFAAAQLGYVGHSTPMADLLAGIQRPELSGNARAVIPIASEIARQVFGKLAPYDAALRAHAGNAAVGFSLIPLFLVADRAWALDHVEQVLGGDDGDASIGLRGALAQLDAAGQAKLAADVRSRYSRLPAANQKSLEEDLKDANL